VNLQAMPLAAYLLLQQLMPGSSHLPNRHTLGLPGWG